MTPNVRILVLDQGSGASRTWPEPLAGYIAEGRVEIEIAATLFDAAAALWHPRLPVVALLLDGDTLSAAEINLLKTLACHKSLLICLLPARFGIRPRSREMSEIGAVAWDESLLELDRILHKAPTQSEDEGNTRNCDLSAYLSKILIIIPPDRPGSMKRK